MTLLRYKLDLDDPNLSPLGLIVLQVDETLEPEFHEYFSDSKCPIYVSRIPSGAEVSTDSLAEMEVTLPAAADLLPKARPYKVVGYACTSASSVIGSERVEELVQETCDVAVVTNPLRAAVACAGDLGVSKLALLSPYVEEVNETLRAAFDQQGLSTDVFGSFGESEEAKVARISVSSIVEAACELGRDPSVEAVFMSCTNLRTLAAIPQIRALISKPVLSSNQCLAWHMQCLNSA
ncbi:maleate cis-trans isomerase family protein [Actibacterium pelagium]|uniref:Asp/Glu racemase n=1 Tax=Actibacterium pelagium TaxID=2029103 RepID=A0A917ELI0_9RHOB|nr:aspartate/glutamate racemase family protein [Actibacterium pelagium]GGE52005.1 Asp/Glu racemase [Actibacterium pelagium]